LAGVIGPTGPVPVLAATRPVDLRERAEGLAAPVREQRQADPLSGAIYVSTRPAPGEAASSGARVNQGRQDAQ
jgi:hypothetical protein